MILRCPSCAWSERCDRDAMRRWLAQAGMLRRRAEPPNEELRELLPSAAERLSCPDCDHSGLTVVSSDEDDEDWPSAAVCEACGKAIPPERLEAFPTATLCVDCQGQAEKGIPPGEPEYCPRCGSLMTLKQSGSTGITRYAMVCTNYPACRGRV